EVSYGADGAIAAVTPVDPRVPRTVTKRTTTDLDSWPYPKRPLVPLAETVHERASVEIFRGCTRGCRFCQAGMITRPVRERSLRGIGEMVDQSVRASGFDEVGLLSLSSADHSEIAEDRKSTRLNSSHVKISYAVFCLKKKKRNAIRSRRDASR